MSYWKNKRVLVTGGHGFLGTHITKALEARGVSALFAVRQREYDLTRESEVERLFQEHPADIVIHLAALNAGILSNKERPAEFFYRNLMMGTLVMHYAWKHGVTKLLAAGAGAGYPQSAPNPLKESDFWNGFPQKESAPYALAKRMLTVQSEAYSRQYGFVSIVAILGSVYGPHDNFNLRDAPALPALVRKFVDATDQKLSSVEIWGSGKAARDFVFVADVVECMLLALENLKEQTVLNMSSGRETPIREIVELLHKISGFQGEVKWNTNMPDGQLHRRFDMTKAEQLLGWHAKTPLEDGLRITVDWYRKHQDTARK